jgi:hypothetical protein
LPCSQGRERKGRRRGRGGFCAAAAAAGEAGGRRRKGRGRREADRWGPGVSDGIRKRKGRERGGPARPVRWAGRPGWAEREAGKVLFFSIFKLLFQTIFLFNFKSNSFKLFLKNL